MFFTLLVELELPYSQVFSASARRWIIFQLFPSLFVIASLTCYSLFCVAGGPAAL